MTGDTDARASDRSPIGRVDRRVRRVAVAWTLVVVAASLVDPATVLEPVGAPPTAGSGGVAFVVAHLVAYGVLAWVLVGGLGPDVRGPRAVLVATAVAAAVGVGVELLQAPVAARTASAADTLLNAVGAAVGAGLRAAVGSR